MNLNSKTFPMPGSLRLLHHLQKKSGSLLVVVMPISLDNLPAPPIV